MTKKKKNTEYMELLQLILTSELPAKKQTQMINALRQLERKHRQDIDKKAKELMYEYFDKELFGWLWETEIIYSQKTLDRNSYSTRPLDRWATDWVRCLWRCVTVYFVIATSTDIHRIWKRRWSPTPIYCSAVMLTT